MERNARQNSAHELGTQFQFKLEKIRKYVGDGRDE